MSMHRPFGLRRSNGHRRRQGKERSKEKTTKLPRQELLVAGVNGQRRKQGKEKGKGNDDEAGMPGAAGSGGP